MVTDTLDLLGGDALSVLAEPSRYGLRERPIVHRCLRRAELPDGHELLDVALRHRAFFDVVAELRERAREATHGVCDLLVRLGER